MCKSFRLSHIDDDCRRKAQAFPRRADEITVSYPIAQKFGAHLGQVIDLASTAAKIRTDRIVVTPSGQRTTQRAGSPGLLELTEQGVYEVRATGATRATRRFRKGLTRATTISWACLCGR